MTKTISVIDSHLMIEGNLISNSQINISGIINGIVCAERIVLNGDGSVNGNVLISQSAIIENGTINGNLIVNSLKLSKNAKIYGDIEYITLMVEDGASISGLVKKIDQETFKGKMNSLLERLKSQKSNEVMENRLNDENK